MNRRELRRRLEHVRWDRLEHAYGPATDTPEAILRLLSRDEEEREEALETLRSSIWHQGTVYPATAEAVPFLVDLVADPKTPDRASIAALLGFIASGTSYADVHEGARLERELAVVRAARAAVRQGLEVYLGALDGARAALHGALLFLLARLRDDAAQILAELSPGDAARIRPALTDAHEHPEDGRVCAACEKLLAPLDVLLEEAEPAPTEPRESDAQIEAELRRRIREAPGAGFAAESGAIARAQWFSARAPALALALAEAPLTHPDVQLRRRVLRLTALARLGRFDEARPGVIALAEEWLGPARRGSANQSLARGELGTLIALVPGLEDLAARLATAPEAELDFGDDDSF